MRELTSEEMRSPAGGVAPVVAVGAVVMAGITLYGAAKSIYNFGKSIGEWHTKPTLPIPEAQ